MNISLYTSPGFPPRLPLEEKRSYVSQDSNEVISFQQCSAQYLYAWCVQYTHIKLLF